MIAHQMKPWRRHQRSDFFNELEGLQNYVCGAIRTTAASAGRRVGHRAARTAVRPPVARDRCTRHKRSKPGRSAAETATLAWRLKPATFAHRGPVRASGYRSSIGFYAIRTGWSACGPVAMRPATEAP